MQSEKNAMGQYRQSRMYYFGVIILTMMAGCGKPSTTKSPLSSNTNNTTNSSTQLDGTWLGSCEVDEGGASSKSDFVVSGSSVTLTTRYYSGGNCATEDSVSVYSLNYSIGGPAASPAGAVEVQQTLSKIMITLKTQQGVTTANEGVKWGEQVIMPPTCNGGFTINVPKELNPTVCAGDLIYGSIFGTTYGIIKIDGDKLYFGETDETNDGSTAAKRPTKLQSSYLTKQTSGSGGGTSGGGSGLSLAGTWLGACEVDEGVSSQSTFAFSGSAYTATSILYSDAGCTQEEAVYVMTGAFTTGSQLSSPAGAFAFQGSTEKYMVTLKTDTAVTNLNSLCGQTLTKDVATELNGTVCAGDPDFGDSFNTNYDIVKVVVDKLYFGEWTETNDGSTIGKRPTSLSSSYYVKQP